MVLPAIPLALLTFGTIEGARVMTCFCESKADVARATVRRYVYEAYPSWLAAHPDQSCPADLDALNEYMNNKDTLDPWANHYTMTCGPLLVVASAGEDGQLGTSDDVFALAPGWVTMPSRSRSWPRSSSPSRLRPPT
jgi:hypothetical protein